MSKTQVKIRKGKRLYTFICETKENYRGKIEEINEESRWFLNQIKQEMGEVLDGL